MSLKRFYAKELVGFSEIELEFEEGLTVFTGASGSGKSVLMDGLLSVFGYKEPKAANAEADLYTRIAALEEIGIDNEEPNTFRYLKKDKTRYFINSKAIAKKDLQETIKPICAYLSSKEEGEFSTARLIGTLDSFVTDKDFADLKKEYGEIFAKIALMNKELLRLKEKSSKAAEEREFLEFEIKKFGEIDPKEGEEEELLALKKELSKKEKIGALLTRTNSILNQKQSVFELLDFLGKDESEANDFFAKLEDAISEADFRLSRLDGIDIDGVFERLEKLSYLSKRYGGVTDAIEYFESKKIELKELDELDSLIASLELDIKNEGKKLATLAERISSARAAAAPLFEERVGFFAKKLLIATPKISLSPTEPTAIGADSIELRLGESRLDTLSAGEFRRLRLALMACESDDTRKILFLDEADANLSGEESAGVAYLLRELAKKYQIFAISHQPQLASVATHHYVVSKDDSGSSVKKLRQDERASEIARMVSAGEITSEALEYAKKMITENISAD